MRVSQLLGHATYTLTPDTYGDYISQDDDTHTALPEPPGPHAGTDATVLELRRRQAT